jgi:hypothetical protein
VMGPRPAPVGTPPDLRSANKVQGIAETFKRSRFGAHSHLSETRAVVQNASPDDPTKKRRTFLEWLFGN